MTATILERPCSRSSVKFHPTTPIIGAEVTGIDLRAELDPETVAEPRAALLDYKVLFFRDQPINDAQQIRFSHYFGAVTPAHPVINGLKERPEIYAKNLTQGREEYSFLGISTEHPLRPARRANTSRGWHIDITFVANPAAVTILRGVEIPDSGGDTLFINLEALYDALSPPMRSFLDSLKVIHVRDDAATTGRQPAPRFDGKPPGPFAALHPLIRIHPETGRKALFLGGFAQAIDGMHYTESTNLLDYLHGELCARADLQTRFRWSKNSIAVWDNRAVAHAGPIDGRHIKGERIVHRTTIAGDLPVGPDGFVSKPLVGELFNAIG